MRNRKVALVIFTLVALTVTVTGCGSTKHTSPTTEATAPAPAPLTAGERGKLCVYQDMEAGDDAQSALSYCVQAAENAYGVSGFEPAQMGAESEVQCILQNGLVGCKPRGAR